MGQAAGCVALKKGPSRPEVNFVKRIHKYIENIPKTQIRVMQWNILCDSLSNNFDRCPAEILTWEYREPLIVHHISRSMADIVCLQEVDKFDSLMQKLSRDFDGECIMKPDNKMGCAILWRKAVVKKLTDLVSEVFLNDKGEKTNQIYVYASFKKGAD